MTRVQVLESICDRCTTEATMPMPAGRLGDGGIVLPPGWLHVSGLTATSVLFTLDLCPDCKLTVMAAAGVARR